MNRGCRSGRCVGILGTLLALSVQLLGCTTYQPYQVDQEVKPLLSIGEWLSFSGYDLTFYDDGLAVLRKGGPRDQVARLEPAELASLRELLASGDFQAALDALRSLGYRPGCCDLHEVSLTFHGEELGYPLWLPACQAHPVDEAVARVVDSINELGSRHFRYIRKNPIPKTTCDIPSQARTGTGPGRGAKQVVGIVRPGRGAK